MEERFRRTLARNVTIAVVWRVFAPPTRRQVLLPCGPRHLVLPRRELTSSRCLHGIRGRLPRVADAVLAGCWCGFAVHPSLACRLRRGALSPIVHLPRTVVAGVAFIGVELVRHAVLALAVSNFP